MLVLTVAMPNNIAAVRWALCGLALGAACLIAGILQT